MSWTYYLIYLLLGCGIGCFSGLLGLGGGLLVVPLLHWIFKSIPETSSNNMHLAISTSLAVMVITSITATLFHSRKKSVLWNVFAWMAVGMFFGAASGPIVSNFFQSRLLEIIFGSVEILTAVFLFFFKPNQFEEKEFILSTAKKLLFVAMGFIASFIGSMLGIGGGVIIVPFLIYLGFSSRLAIGTSAAATMLTAIIGTLSELIDSFSVQIPFSIGYIFLPATIALSIGSLICTPLGVKLTHKLPERHLKKIFILVLVAFGIIMII